MRMTTSNVMDNEIIMAVDFNNSFNAQIINIVKMLQGLLECNKDFIISQENIVNLNNDWSISLSPLLAVSHSTRIPVLETTESLAIANINTPSIFDRYDIVEIRGVYKDTTEEKRVFTETNTSKKIDTVNTRKELIIECQILSSAEGENKAPAHTEGWIKVAEIFVPASAESILDCTVNNISCDTSNGINENWTNDKDIVYNIHYISDVNERFRAEHNVDGSHKASISTSNYFDYGPEQEQVNSTHIPIGKELSVCNETIAASISTVETLKNLIEHINDVYEKYINSGDYNFSREVVINGDVSKTYNKSKKLKIGIKEDNSVYIKIGDSEVLNFTDSGKITTMLDYLTSNKNSIVNKKTTDSIENNIASIKADVKTLEEMNDRTVYSNDVLSRYSLSNISIAAATTSDISLSGLLRIDNIDCGVGYCILVKDQTNKRENGIYRVTENSWVRMESFIQPNSLKGFIFNVQNGNKNKGKLFYCSVENFTNNNLFGYDNILFSEYFGSVEKLSNKSAIRNNSGNIKSNTSNESNDVVTRNEITNNKMKSVILDFIYPVGTLYWSSKDESPSTLFGGTWSKIENKFILAAGSTYKVDETGGNFLHKITVDNLPSHEHGMSHEHGFQPKGNISKHSHSYKPTATIPDHEHKYTPSGTISTDSAPTFSGSTLKEAPEVTGMSENAKSFWYTGSETSNRSIFRDSTTANVDITRGSKANSYNMADNVYYNKFIFSGKFEHTHTFTPEGKVGYDSNRPGTTKNGIYTFSGDNCNTSDTFTDGTIPISIGRTSTATASTKFNGSTKEMSYTGSTETNTTQNNAIDTTPIYLTRYCWERIA